MQAFYIVLFNENELFGLKRNPLIILIITIKICQFCVKLKSNKSPLFLNKDEYIYVGTYIELELEGQVQE